LDGFDQAGDVLQVRRTAQVTGGAFSRAGFGHGRSLHHS
jgi:hypothetical protein